MKTFLISLFIIVATVLFILYLHIYDAKDACLDLGFCKEGLILNTENGQIVINEKTCKQENGVWDNKKKVCRFQ